MHPRACVSAISTFRLSLPEDLTFWDAHRITTVGVSVAKLEAFGWDKGTALVREAIDRGLRVADLIGLGPFQLAHPDRWDAQRERVVRSIETASTLGVPLLVFTTGPFVPLTWNEAADALEAALAPPAFDSRSNTRTRCAPTSGSCTRLPTRSTSRTGSTRACAWR
jgi:sugar phosphate isomerase/epimerase